ncbi:hypothetical protein YC2023_016256 [Brassica napus]
MIIASTASSPSCSPNNLLSGSLEIHLVSWVNIVGVRAHLIRLMGYVAFIGFSPPPPNPFSWVYQHRF